MKIIDPLTTSRLILRQWKTFDLTPFHHILLDEQVCEFFPQQNRILKTTQKIIQSLRDHFKKHHMGLYVCEHRQTGDFMGYVGLNYVNFKLPFCPTTEISWLLGSQFWGQGYATEAAKHILDHAFLDLALKEVVAFTVPKNIRSRRVMEKIGFTHYPEDDFSHPKIEVGHPLREHVLYRLTYDHYVSLSKQEKKIR